MPMLDFKGKALVYAHHLGVPFRELVVDAKKSLPPKGKAPSLDDNLILHGDNLHALKALLPTYAGKIDCIYIDPPYNTGNEGWCYNDNVRSPLMREWLKSASPVDKEDLERHDKWLSMMWPRLRLLRELMSPTGTILVSIDDNEGHRLKCIMDEVFDADHFIGLFCWKTRNTDNRVITKLSVDHEYVLVYSRAEGLRGRVIDRSDFTNPDNDKRGPYVTDPLTGKATQQSRPNLHYTIVNPKTGDKYPPDPSRGWITDKEGFQALLEDNRISWPPNPDSGNPRKKRFLTETQERMPASSFWSDLKGQSGADELDAIMGKRVFDFPKSLEFMTRVMDYATATDSIILDSFAGSGTTAHAVLALNKKDGGERKFILVECEEYADKLTAERVRRVIRGYSFEGTQREELFREKLTWTRLKKAGDLVEQVEGLARMHEKSYDQIEKKVEEGEVVVYGVKQVKEKTAGLGGSFTYAELGDEVSAEKMLGGTLPEFEVLARYVFHTATGLTLSGGAKPRGERRGVSPPWTGHIGDTERYRVHLWYKADPKWLSSNEAALTEQLVEKMQKENSEKKRLMVFAAMKFLSQKELAALGVEFCQLPWAIHRIIGESVPK